MGKLQFVTKGNRRKEFQRDIARTMLGQHIVQMLRGKSPEEAARVLDSITSEANGTSVTVMANGRTYETITDLDPSDTASIVRKIEEFVDGLRRQHTGKALTSKGINQQAARQQLTRWVQQQANSKEEALAKLDAVTFGGLDTDQEGEADFKLAYNRQPIVDLGRDDRGNTYYNEKLAWKIVEGVQADVRSGKLGLKQLRAKVSAATSKPVGGKLKAAATKGAVDSNLLASALLRWAETATQEEVDEAASNASVKIAPVQSPIQYYKLILQSGNTYITDLGTFEGDSARTGANEAQRQARIMLSKLVGQRKGITVKAFTEAVRRPAVGDTIRVKMDMFTYEGQIIEELGEVGGLGKQYMMRYTEPAGTIKTMKVAEKAILRERPVADLPLHTPVTITDHGRSYEGTIASAGRLLNTGEKAYRVIGKQNQMLGEFPASMITFVASKGQIAADIKRVLRRDSKGWSGLIPSKANPNDSYEVTVSDDGLSGGVIKGKVNTEQGDEKHFTARTYDEAMLQAEKIITDYERQTTYGRHVKAKTPEQELIDYIRANQEESYGGWGWVRWPPKFGTPLVNDMIRRGILVEGRNGTIVGINGEVEDTGSQTGNVIRRGEKV